MQKERIMLSGIVALAVSCFAVHDFAAAAEEGGDIECKIYGRAHVSAESLDDGEDSSEYLSSNSSRIGFKGSADLKDELKAIWQVETEVKIDESGTEFATRNSYAGLSSSFGTALVGRHDSPYKTLGRKVDLFNDQIGDSRNITGINAYGCDLRLNNVIMYESPVMKGMNLVAAYSAEEGTDDTSIGSISANYSIGDLFLGVGYEEHGKMLSGIDTDEDDTIDSPSEKAENGVRMVGSYKWKNLKLTALYEILGNVNGIADTDRDTWGTGAAYELGSNTFRAQFYSTCGVEGTSDDEACMYAIGLDHNFSENTMAYIAYAATENGENACLRMSGAGHGEKVTPLTGDDPSGIAVGIIHNF